jgi:hypothetical protein
MANETPGTDSGAGELPRDGDAVPDQQVQEVDIGDEEEWAEAPVVANSASAGLVPGDASRLAVARIASGASGSLARRSADSRVDRS